MPKDAKHESQADAQHFSKYPIRLRELADRPSSDKEQQASNPK
jgi:hypothetical protein